MGFFALLPVVGPVIEKILGVIDKAVPDKDLATKLKAEFETQLSSMDYSYLEKEIEARAKVIVTEAESQSWIARNWRPITMLVFVYIVAHNYIIAPVIAMFYPGMVRLEVPPDLWDLLKLGIGGYIVGRTGEKMIKTWKGKSDIS